MTPPRVSLVMPTRNRVRLLSQAIESCRKQTLTDWELIVVDDASTDETSALVQGVGDARISYIRQDRQQGSVAALNRGFAMARGQYLSWISDDDYYSCPEALKILADALDAQPEVGFVYAQYDMVDENGVFLRPARVEPPSGLDRDNYVGHAFLYRREVYATIGDYSPVYFLTEEYEYWLRVREKFSMKMLPQRLYCHRLHASSLTMSHREAQVQEMVARARKRFIPSWKQHYFLGETYYHQRRCLLALGNLVWSLVLRPFNRGGWRLLALIILPVALVNYVRNRRVSS